MKFEMILCSYLGITRWLQNHLIACPFKILTGIDCPGCGFQRSVIALLQGNLKQSLFYYPATIPLFAAILFTLVERPFKLDKSQYFKTAIYTIAGFIIIGSYVLKMSGHPFIAQP